ncbi:2OG-Fe(II) oxygenase [Methylobacterium crusticola]|uniref:2OG-Fe(II) oxygenase n=1 Tax=Methylobacterium crusticola TaxID=1697972 RepID=UPI001EE39DEA|nr:2OG-Fe(II) oxygenase [Methylobacterium crusticola]
MPIAAGGTWDDRSIFTEERFASLHRTYKNAIPYPHLVFDGLFPPQHLEAALDAFAPSSLIDWRSYKTDLMQKAGTAPNSDLPPAAQAYFDTLYSGPFLRFLTRLTGIPNLIPDPSLYGGGMHEVSGGGRFEIHVDFQRHPETRLDNRLAVITYLNHDWREAYGGALELWETEPAHCGARITPQFGTTVVMEQSAIAAHGHPALVRSGLRRRALIAYFYTNGREDAPGPANETTIYIRHGGQNLRQRGQIVLREVLPPRMLSLLKSLNARLRSP